MSLNTVFDLNALYQNYFGNKPYHITETKSTSNEKPYTLIAPNPTPKGTTVYTKKNIALNKQSVYGKDIWFPIELWLGEKQLITIDTCTIGVNLSATIIRTPVSERKGTVKESFYEDDYKFNIKGFLIGKNRQFPEEEILLLKQFKESHDAKELRGGYPELFLDESCRVAVVALDFPEVQGKAPHIRPFTLTLESDFIQDITIQANNIANSVSNITF